MKASAVAEPREVTIKGYGQGRKDQTMCELKTTTDTVVESPARCAEEVAEGTGLDTGEELRTTEHKQVYIKAYGREAEVDEEIAPLILELWRCGIWTLMSCQEGAHGYVWVCFPDPNEAAEFMNIVAEFDPAPESLYQRMLSDWDVPNNWIFDTFPRDDNLFEEDPTSDDVHEYHKGPPDFAFEISVRFPPSDLPAVMTKLAAHTPDDWMDDDRMDAAVPLSKVD
jgi:hypothetical protein